MARVAVPCRWPLLIPAAVLDGIFLVGLIILHGKTFERALSSIATLTVMTQDFVARAGSPDQLNQLALQNAEFAARYHEFLAVAAAMLLGGFTLWVVFRGLASYLALRMAGAKVPFWRFLGKHALLTAFWSIALLVILGISIKLISAAFSPLPLLNERMANAITFLLLAVLGYFGMVSYALIPLQRTLRTALKIAVSRHAKRLLPRYLAGLALLAVLALNVLFFFKLHLLAGAAALLLLFLPGISIARLLLYAAALSAAKKAA